MKISLQTQIFEKKFALKIASQHATDLAMLIP
jgi:hypothetical protein